MTVDEIRQNGEFSNFLPNMKYILTFKTFNNNPVNFCLNEKEYYGLQVTDFDEITKDMALQAQKNTIAAAAEDPKTPMSDYLDWVEATEALESALKEEKILYKAFSKMCKKLKIIPQNLKELF